LHRGEGPSRASIFQAPESSADGEGVLIQHKAMLAKRAMIRRLIWDNSSMLELNAE
jgi:hypothetical protein